MFKTVEGQALLQEWMENYVCVASYTPNDLYTCGWNDAMRSFVINLKRDLDSEPDDLLTTEEEINVG